MATAEKSEATLAATPAATVASAAQATDAATTDAAGPAPASALLSGFDDLIARVRDAVPADARTQAAPDIASLPYKVGPHAGRSIVLRSQTAIELGGAERGSCAMTLSTSDESLVSDGRVTVAGPDIDEIVPGQAAPIAQIVIAAGSELRGSDHQKIEDCQSVCDYIEGYLVRCAGSELAARVGNDLYDKGFSLESLGAALIDLVKGSVSGVRAVEVIFVTSGDGDVARMAALRPEWERISHSLRRDAWLDRGVDIDCPNGGHCGSCADKDVCDQVRKIGKMREALARAKA
jgi:CO dehydrogenase/acetyl-CoA synthase beta subunit